MTPTTDVQIAPDLRRVKRAVIASYVTFGGAGFAIASWASRIPQVRDRLHLDSSELGLVLLAVAVGSLLSLPLSGPTIARFGSRRTVTVTAALLGVALLTVAFGYRIGVAPVVVGLFLLGSRRAPGTWRSTCTAPTSSSNSVDRSCPASTPASAWGRSPAHSSARRWSPAGCR